MLRINLLPQDARQATLSSIEQFHRTPLMWLVVSAMLVFGFSQWLRLEFNRSRLEGLMAQVERLEPKRQEVERVQRLVRKLRAEDEAFRGLKQGGGLWSKRLNVLSDITPDGVWFTDLELDQETGLVIQGSVISHGGSEMVAVGQLRADLKADPEFAAAIEDVQIESIKRVQDKEIELVQFTLTCALRKAPTPD